jgi:hypothetical protein
MVQRFLGMGVGARAGVGIKNGLISKREGGCCWNFPQLRLGDPKGLPFFYVQVWRSGWSRMDAQQDRPLALEMSLWHVGGWVISVARYRFYPTHAARRQSYQHAYSNVFRPERGPAARGLGAKGRGIKNPTAGEGGRVGGEGGWFSLRASRRSGRW